MAEPFLILHKVRGEPAFDIAERCQIGDEEGWIIPTSGHRAYPSSSCPLSCLRMAFGDEYLTIDWIIPNFESLPDHYAVNDRKVAEHEIDIGRRLIKLLGIGPKVERRL